jgi:hypothetical protein
MLFPPGINGTERRQMLREARMEPLAPENILSSNFTWKEKLASYLATQSATTVLLFAVFGFGGYWSLYGMPMMMAQFESGYKRNAELLERTAIANEKAIMNLVQQWREDRRIMFTLLGERSRLDELERAPQPN